MRERNIYQEAINKASDEELIEAGVGCNNLFKGGIYADCKYKKNGRCTRGAILTSTLCGAHPADCPLYNVVSK